MCNLTVSMLSASSADVLSSRELVDQLTLGTSICQVSLGLAGPPGGHSAFMRLCWPHIELHRAGTWPTLWALSMMRQHSGQEKGLTLSDALCHLLLSCKGW